MTVAGGDMVSISDAAKRLGVSRQALAKQVTGLEADGVLTCVKQGRAKLVDFVALEKARNDETPTAADADGVTVADVKREKVQAETDLARLKLEKLQGKLVDAKQIETALVDRAKRISQQFSTLPGLADELAAIAQKKGADGVRKRLRVFTRDILESISNELASAAEGAIGD